MKLLIVLYKSLQNRVDKVCLYMYVCVCMYVCTCIYMYIRCIYVQYHQQLSRQVLTKHTHPNELSLR